MSLERPPTEHDSLGDKLEYVMRYAINNLFCEAEIEFVDKALEHYIKSNITKTPSKPAHMDRAYEMWKKKQNEETDSRSLSRL